MESEFELELWSENWITIEMELEQELKLLSENWIGIEIEIISWTEITLLYGMSEVSLWPAHYVPICKSVESTDA